MLKKTIPDMPPPTDKPIQPVNGDPETKLPVLTYWAKRNIAGDNEAALKNILIDAITSCAPPPPDIGSQTVGEATQAVQNTLYGTQSRIAQCCTQYGIKESALHANARLRLREDGELEVFNVDSPFAQTIQPATLHKSKPSDIDYPANKELQAIITSDIWRNLTTSEKEAAVAAVNEELANRRQHIDLLARIEAPGLAADAKAAGCFCSKSNCPHDRLSTSINPLTIAVSESKPSDLIQVRDPADFDTPQSPAQTKRQRLALKEPRTITPKVAKVNKNRASQPWFGPRP